ncbi:MAG: TldD/PmbA family protein [Nitrospinaceae bacterium]
MHLGFLIFLVALGGSAPVLAAANGPDSAIFQAMEAEIERSLTDLKIDVFNPPYFLLYQIRHHDNAEVAASFGSLIRSNARQERTLFVDVRVGDKKFDSSHPHSHRLMPEQLIPIDNEVPALRRALWYETDLRYKQAIMNYLKKKGRLISGLENHDLPDFARGADPRTRLEPVPDFPVTLAVWEDLAKRVSARFKQAPNIEKSLVKIVGNRTIRYYLDSEGTKILDGGTDYGIVLEAWTKTPQGHEMHDQETLLYSNLEALPSLEELNRKADGLIKNLQALKKAPAIDPYVGPALFSPDATAVLFHEAIGHRLEGDRLRLEKNGKTFLKKVGLPILPDFITVVDNPRLERFNGEPLLGHYRLDDQGQKSEEVVLIQNGVLRNFLMSRAPILGFSRTNGHARSDGRRFPISRMGNLIVQSAKTASAERLKALLIEEVKRQHKPFGLHVKKILSGETLTDGGRYQVFKGLPLYMYKVFPDGREELVRGAEFVGTPLSMIGKILMTGNDTAVINGFCTAESGVLPVTSITPTVLLSEVELQTAHPQRMRPPILPPPAVAWTP